MIYYDMYISPQVSDHQPVTSLRCQVAACQRPIDRPRSSSALVSNMVIEWGTV